MISAIGRLAKRAINGTFLRSFVSEEYQAHLRSLPHDLLFIPKKTEKDPQKEKAAF